MNSATSSREETFSRLLHIVANRYWAQRKRSFDLIDPEEKAFLESIDYPEDEFLDFIEDYLGIGEDSLRWTRQVAERGESSAQNRLGYMYANGFGVEQNHVEAAKWYRKAAEQGIMTAQCGLAYFYTNGLGLARDHAQAVYWYLKAAERGSQYAQVQLGWLYRYGQGIVRDSAQARQWLGKAAAQGSVEARDELQKLEAGSTTGNA